MISFIKMCWKDFKWWRKASPEQRAVRREANAWFAGFVFAVIRDGIKDAWANRSERKKRKELLGRRDG